MVGQVVITHLYQIEIFYTASYIALSDLSGQLCNGSLDYRRQ